MGRSRGDDMILSYNDVVLRRSDLDILSGPYFLNDRIIDFYFSYLASCYPSDDILLVSPSIAFWLQNCADKESLKAFAEPLNFPAKNLIIFPVNNNDDVTEAEGGSHWSLLAYHRSANVFFHHDSSGRLNHIFARQLFSSVVDFTGRSGSLIVYQEHVSSPQQKNGYDCGLFVTSIARVICIWYTKNLGHIDLEELWLPAVKEEVTPSAVSSMRNDILGLIKGLMVTK